MREPLGVDHLLPDRGVGGAAADGEVVALHDRRGGRRSGPGRTTMLAGSEVGRARRPRRRSPTPASAPVSWKRARVEQALDPLAHRQPAATRAGARPAPRRPSRARAPRGGAAPRARAPSSCGGSLAGMWSNWSRGQSCAPAEHVRPASRAELSEAVAAAAARCAWRAPGHSFSRRRADRRARCCRSTRLDRVLDADRDSGLVRVEAGIRLHRARRASCTRAGWRCRTSATSTPSRSPARSPPARTARARGCRTSPRRSRRSSSCSPTAASATRRRRRRAARRARRARRARASSPP